MGMYKPCIPWMSLPAGPLCEYMVGLFEYSNDGPGSPPLLSFRLPTVWYHRRTRGARPGNEALMMPIIASKKGFSLLEYISESCSPT